MPWDKSQFRERLTALYKAAGLDRAEFARLIDVPRPTVTGWMWNDKARPSVDVFIHVANALHTTPGWLAFGELSQPATEEEQRAVRALRKLGEPQRQKMIEMLETVTAGIIQEASKRAPKFRRKTNAPEPTVPQVTEIEKNPKRVNRRDELRTYPIVRKGPGVAAIPKFEAVAAGFGEDLSPSPDLTYIRELPDWRDVHSIIVRGDSMEDTLRPDDLILVRAFHAGEGLTLDALSHGDAKTPVKQIEQFIPDDKIYVMSIGAEPPTVKRVRYDIHGPRDWHLLIVPDNPQYKTRVLPRETELRFWGQVVGIGEGKYVKR